MTAGTTDIFDKEILVTRKPFNYFLLIAALAILCVSYLALITFRQFNLETSLTVAIVFLCIAFVVYANLGQYLATVSLYDHRLEVNYIFPWNKSFKFIFDELAEVDSKDIPFQNGRVRWYIGGKWLFLRNEKNEVCQFSYNINDSADKILLTELRKKVRE